MTVDKKLNKSSSPERDKRRKAKDYDNLARNLRENLKRRKVVAKPASKDTVNSWCAKKRVKLSW
jgi:hypothetical protein